MSINLLTFALKALFPQDADEGQELGDLLQIQHSGVVEFDDGHGLFVVGAAASVLPQPEARHSKISGGCGAKARLNERRVCPPVDAGDVDDHVNHIAAQLIGLHVYGRAVCGDVDLADNIKQKGLLYP